MSFKQGFKQETNKFGYSFEYRAGYFKALVDTCNFFEKHSDLFASNRWFSKKKMPRLLEALAEGSELLMMYGDVCGLKEYVKDGRFEPLPYHGADEEVD